MRAIALMGPTACGKTALGLCLAQHFPIEIISVDSALVYRDMNIGTAKPSQAERALCPHHLIDILSPLESYSVAQFCEDAARLIQSIHARGNLPVLLGGTFLYFKALQQGLSSLPHADRELRKQLDQDAALLGWPALHARLAQLDPQTALRLKPTDSQRIQRALEVCILTGQPLSHYLAEQSRTLMPLDILNLALVPSDRAWLHHRIALRFSAMLAQGLLAEVEQLSAMYPGLSPHLPAMRCVGYRQAWEYQMGNYDYATFLLRGVAATRQLAKRQMTWLRSLTVEAFEPQSLTLATDVINAVNSWLKQQH